MLVSFERLVDCCCRSGNGEEESEEGTGEEDVEEEDLGFSRRLGFLTIFVLSSSILFSAQ